MAIANGARVRAVGLLFASAVAGGAACGPSGDSLPAIAPGVRMPFVAQRLALPEGVRATAVWVGAEARGVVALEDGRFFAVSPVGAVAPIDRTPGETTAPGDAPVARLAARSNAEVLALTPGGALLVQSGLYRRAQLPMFLASPRAYAPWSTESLWATADGLYTSEGPRWLRLDDAAGAVRNAEEVAPVAAAQGGGREAWVRAGNTLRRVRVVSGAEPMITWYEMPAAVRFGAVHSLAVMDAARAAAASDRGVFVLSAMGVRGWSAPMERGAPSRVAGGGGWAWVVWGSEVLRTDGERWEALARDAALAQPDAVQLAVDPATGTSALVIDGDGRVIRIESDEVVRVAGLTDGAVLLDPAVPLEVVPTRAEAPQEVQFFLDDGAMPVAVRMAAPWGWGEGGARVRDLARVTFGEHRVRVTVRYPNRTIERTIRFAYTSPFGRVPTYDRDIAPLYVARCARCHTSGVAQELGTYEALRARAPIARASVRDHRMPPDVLLDSVSEALFIAWVDGDAPR